MIDINWRTIRSLNGSQHDAFEELCSQLASAEIPANAYFVRNAPPDAGVECYAVFPDHSEWGWQAKFFDVLGNSQWSQIDDSVRTALQKHPRLVRYYVCIPLDLPDARLRDQQSARDKWNEHVSKWRQWAAALNMDVTFVFWGSHELYEHMTRPEHFGRLRFFFDAKRFHKSWFEDRLAEAVNAAGPRYTPEIHVDLPIAFEFEAFGRTDRFFETFKSRSRGLRNKLRWIDNKDPNDNGKSSEIASSKSQVVVLLQKVLAELEDVRVDPVEKIPFQQIIARIEDAIAATEHLEEEFHRLETEYEAQKSDASASKPHSVYRNPFRDDRYRLLDVQQEAYELRDALQHDERVVLNQLLLITGAAGTGKTHLLCDVAKKRIEEGHPTILLMGQRFLNMEEPWRQALQHLDLADLSIEEFVGALEAAAQAKGCRALVIIDALNEGTGRFLWPGHLPAFIAHLERSPWIGIVLAVRSTYEDIVVPEEIRKRAAHVTHVGFSDHEYDATKTFFYHYGLELPSTPLLVPEFRNPLFLKTLCTGLQESGKRRLPRGTHGITSIFQLYLSSINEKLARELDFDPKGRLVQAALSNLAETLIREGKHWLPREKTRRIIDNLLPERNFERSLYRGLISEGVLTEDRVPWQTNGGPEEVVYLSYERIADHLIAGRLLDRYLGAIGIRRSTRVNSVNRKLFLSLVKLYSRIQHTLHKKEPLGFLGYQGIYVSAGLLESLCIHFSESVGLDLLEIAPWLRTQPAIGEAFRQSLIWRDPNAFSNTTREILNELIRTEYDLHATLDVLLTVATLPEHPLNASFLDQRLRQARLADRDSWWSTYLHHAWGHGVVGRIIDWASTITPNDNPEDGVVNLCSTTLAWMLTTSNRYLRDRATKGLVSLLTGRVDLAAKLVQHFSDVDDPYVTERVYAVAYGTAMRSHDKEKVGNLALFVYNRVFAKGSPPAHILLRDYARGVVERALYLNADIDIDAKKIRPPYQSPWPAIPTEEEIRPLLPDWSRGSYDSGELEWARNRIGSSVMSDDFGRYVIGTNSGTTHWLSLRLDEPVWHSPNAQLAAFIDNLSKEEREAWNEYESRKAALHVAMLPFVKIIVDREEEKAEENSDHVAIGDGNDNEDLPSDIQQLLSEQENVLNALMAALTEEHSQQLEAILEAKESGAAAPRFDLHLIQRYVLWRVFNLGWTTDRFGHFDRFATGYHGREASKAERIGKKYQWIAYHEIMAYVADHFQFREIFSESEEGQVYDGPWQVNLRNIDPSCTLRSTPGGTSWSGHSTAWWGLEKYDNWNAPEEYLEWVKRYEELPSIESLLVVKRPEDGTEWVNLHGYLNWQQKTPAGRDPNEVERRELWYIFTGHLIREEELEIFMSWAETVDFWGRWMPEPPETYELFLGEYGWSPAFHGFQKLYDADSDQGWIRPRDCPIKVKTAAFEYVRESSGFDCSIDDNYTLRLPAVDMVHGLGLRWSGHGADFIDNKQQLVAFDPTAHQDGPSAILIRLDTLREFLAREKLALCWTVMGEKRVIGSGFLPSYYAELRMSGAYTLNHKGPGGFLKCLLEETKQGNGDSVLSLMGTLRTPS